MPWKDTSLNISHMLMRMESRQPGIWESSNVGSEGGMCETGQRQHDEATSRNDGRESSICWLRISWNDNIENGQLSRCSWSASTCASG